MRYQSPRIGLPFLRGLYIAGFLLLLMLAWFDPPQLTGMWCVGALFHLNAFMAVIAGAWLGSESTQSRELIPLLRVAHVSPVTWLSARFVSQLLEYLSVWILRWPLYWLALSFGEASWHSIKLGEAILGVTYVCAWALASWTGYSRPDQTSTRRTITSNVFWLIVMERLLLWLPSLLLSALIALGLLTSPIWGSLAGALNLLSRMSLYTQLSTAASAAVSWPELAWSLGGHLLGAGLVLQRTTRIFVWSSGDEDVAPDPQQLSQLTGDSVEGASAVASLAGSNTASDAASETAQETALVAAEASRTSETPLGYPSRVGHRNATRRAGHGDATETQQETQQETRPHSRPSRRVWDDALAWQSYVYFSGGDQAVVLRCVVYGLLVVALALMAATQWARDAVMPLCLVSAAGALLFQTKVASDCWSKEIKEGTLSTLGLLPVEPVEILDGWHRGGLRLSWPDMVFLTAITAWVSILSGAAGATAGLIAVAGMVSLPAFFFLAVLISCWSVVGFLTSLGIVFVALTVIVGGTMVSAFTKTPAAGPAVVLLISPFLRHVCRGMVGRWVRRELEHAP